MISWRKLLSIVMFAVIGALSAAPEVKDVAGKQIDLCMIGDSITWANQGDYFRKYLLERMPELAFVGTHTAQFGYSHAGEGGNATPRVLQRIDDPERVPNCRYYHLLIGVNDSSGAKNEEQVDKVAKGTAERIVRIVNILLAKPGTEKVFLGTIFPCSPDNGDQATDELKERFKYRDMAAAATNEILRRDVPTLFPAGKVVLIEYEKPLRELPERRQIIRLHPVPEGYKVVTAITAEALKKETTPAQIKAERFGVEVTNLWNAQDNCTRPLVPGWYVVSFDVKKLDSPKLELLMESKNPESLKHPFKKTFSIKGESGKRAEFEFMTGYEGYGYTMSALQVSAKNGEIDRIQIEKMRPSRKASIYGINTFIDAESPMNLGEKLVPTK